MSNAPRHDTIDNELERMRNHGGNPLNPADRRRAGSPSDPISIGSDPEPIGVDGEYLSSEEGAPEEISSYEQSSETWSDSAPEAAQGGKPNLESSEELLSAHALPPDQGDEEEL